MYYWPAAESGADDCVVRLGHPPCTARGDSCPNPQSHWRTEDEGRRDLQKVLRVLAVRRRDPGRGLQPEPVVSANHPSRMAIRWSYRPAPHPDEHRNDNGKPITLRARESTRRSSLTESIQRRRKAGPVAWITKNTGPRG